MKRLFYFLFIFLLFSTFISQSLFCEESTEPIPYAKEEFPQWALDLRRFEVVSLGSIPFAMIGVTLVYGSIEKNNGNYSSIPNPLNPSSLDESEQLKILGLTVCTGVAIGVVDFAVNKIIQYNKKKKIEKLNARKKINVIPLEEEDDKLENTEDEVSKKIEEEEKEN